MGRRRLLQRKRYDVKGKPAQPVAPAVPAAQLTAKDLDMMMPFRTVVVDQQPTMQEKLQSEVNLAAGAAVLLHLSQDSSQFPKKKPTRRCMEKLRLSRRSRTLNRGVPGERTSTVKNLTSQVQVWESRSSGLKIEPSKTQKGC
jgi:hypothetical protein